FFQAEDGIRDFHVTGVQTCALPIFRRRLIRSLRRSDRWAGDAKADAPVDVIPPRVTTSIIETTRHVLDDTRVGSPIGQRDDAGDAANGRRLSIHPCHGSESKERAHRASHGLPPPSMSV